MPSLRDYSEKFSQSSSFAANLASAEVAGEEFRDWVSALALEMGTSGFPIRTPSGKVFAEFAHLPFESKKRAFHFLGELSKSFEQSKLQSAFEMMKRPVELETASRFLWRLGARAGDETYFDHVDDGDCIEIYGLDGIQLYRSWSCFQVCSYSLADLLTYTWNELYERPSWAAAEISAKIELAIAEPSKSFQYDVPEYVMLERFADDGNMIQFVGRKIGAIVDCKSNQPIALCSTARAVVVDSKGNSENLRFL